MTLVVLQTSSTVALWTLKSGASETTGLIGEPATLPIRSVDPRRAYTLSPPVAYALLSFAEKATPQNGPVEDNKPSQTVKRDPADAQHRTYKELWHLILATGDNRSIDALREFDRGRDRDIKKVLATLPPDLAQQFEASDGADLAEPRKIRLSDDDVVKGVTENILHIYTVPDANKAVAEQWLGRSGDYDPNDPKVQALRNGTGRIMRGTDFPEIGYNHDNEKVYGPDLMTGKTVEKGERSGAHINPDFVSDFEKKNPNLKIHVVYLYQDVALFIYPVTKGETASSLENRIAPLA